MLFSTIRHIRNQFHSRTPMYLEAFLSCVRLVPPAAFHDPAAHHVCIASFYSRSAPPPYSFSLPPLPTPTPTHISCRAL